VVFVDECSDDHKGIVENVVIPFPFLHDKVRYEIRIAIENVGFTSWTRLWELTATTPCAQCMLHKLAVHIF
jgi:hypothetical protein